MLEYVFIRGYVKIRVGAVVFNAKHEYGFRAVGANFSKSVERWPDSYNLSQNVAKLFGPLRL